jgi:hypothetical protein
MRGNSQPTSEEGGIAAQWPDRQAAQLASAILVTGNDPVIAEPLTGSVAVQKSQEWDTHRSPSFFENMCGTREVGFGRASSEPVILYRAI